jgi:two-component system cell cycle sensor histidine kinase PleC
MAHAGARMRGRAWRFARKSAARNLAGYARVLSHPFYEQLLQSERVLRNLVPVLIVVFMAIVAAARWVSLSVEYDRISNAAQNELHFLSDAIVSAIEDVTDDTGKPAPVQELQNALSDAVPSRFLLQGRQVAVTDAAGTIIATAPQDRSLHGQSLDTQIPDSLLLTTFGRSADTREVELADGEKAFAAHRILVEPLGGVTVIQPTERIFRSWRNNVSMNVTLFVGTSSIMLVVLYAYFAQGARAEEADQIYGITQNRFDTALTRASSGLWDWDLARGRIYWSSSMYSLLGLPPREETQGFAEVAALIHPEDADLYDLARKVVDGHETVIDQAFRMQHADGRWIWLRARAQVAVNVNGDKHLICIAVDVTEEQKLRKQSARNDKRLRDAIENLSEAFVLWDADKRLVMCNSKYQQLHGLPAGIARTGAHYDDVMAAASTPMVRNQIVSSELPDGGGRTIEAQLEDGRWLQVNERRTRNGGYVSVGTDVTAIKSHERKLMESERRLMASVEDLHASRQILERQAQLLHDLNENLEAEKSRAESANRTKSEFLANISHELRTPLNAIIGFSEIMNAEMFGKMGSDKYREYSRDIHHSGTYLLGVINDILDMSKIEAGRFTLDIEEFSLNEILDETQRIMAHQAQDRGIEIEADIRSTIVIEADRRAIKQVLINLLSNAVKFCNDGGRVKVQARCIQGSLALSIEDNGIGISRADLKKLGRPFEQVQNQFTKSHKGSGLGLAISRSLAEMHGGAMKIRSRKGEGTIVSLRLPVRPHCSEQTPV